MALKQIVRMKGLEPPRLTAPDPKSGAAANYATSAARIYYFNYSAAASPSAAGASLTAPFLA